MKSSVDNFYRRIIKRYIIVKLLSGFARRTAHCSVPKLIGSGFVMIVVTSPLNNAVSINITICWNHGELNVFKGIL